MGLLKSVDRLSKSIYCAPICTELSALASKQFFTTSDGITVTVTIVNKFR